jgi:hypothetical protein
VTHGMRGAALLAAGAVSLSACTPEWARQNASPYVLEIAGINGGATVNSDVGLPVTNDDVSVTVNIFRKNNNPSLGVSAVGHVSLESYQVRFLRSDGRNQEGVDVPFRITGALGNVRLHTPSAGGETEATVSLTLVRHQAKLDPPLRNFQIDPTSPLNSSGQGTAGANFPGSVVLTTVAEITIYARTIEGDALQATGRVNVTFADFP